MVTDGPLTTWELEARLIYSAMVAGKSARFADRVVRRLLDSGDAADSPFQMIRRWEHWGSLPDLLREIRSGSYTRLGRALPEMARLDPRTCTLEELERVHGIGPKTARFFLLWTRPGVRVAALDTHILKFLRSLGHDAPKSTPTAGRRYRELEDAFLAEADKRGQTPRDLDWEVWDAYSRGQTMSQGQLL